MRKICCLAFEDLVSVENLCEAWQEFIRGKRKKKDVQEFMLHLGDGIADLHADLMNGEYAHGPYSHFRMNDPKPRDIHKAMVRDRLLHHALHRKLYPFFAPIFVWDSFSCQSGKGVHRALLRFASFARKVGRNNSRTCWVLKCDVRKFFASIDHGILTDILKGRISNPRVMDLLTRVVRSFEASPGKGIPLGNLTSQLFANVYMNEFDQFVKHDLRATFYIRYADDFVLLSDDRSQLLEYLPRVAGFLAGPLALDLHPDKVFIKTLASGVDFLGWIHFPYHRIPRTRTKVRMLKRARKAPTYQGIRSYVGLLRHGDAHRLSEEILNAFWLFSGESGEVGF